MKKIRWISFIGIIVVLSFFVIGGTSQQIYIMRLPTQEEVTIFQDVFARSVWDNEEANYKNDPSILKDVYINDTRGGMLSNEEVMYIQSARNDTSLTLAQLSFLDYEEAICIMLNRLTVKTQAIEEKMKAEGRTQMSQEEIQSYWDQTAGTFFMPEYIEPPRTSVDQIKSDVTIQSVDLLSSDFAIVVAKLGILTTEYHVVKFGERWYIAGERGISNDF